MTRLRDLVEQLVRGVQRWLRRTASHPLPAALALVHGAMNVAAVWITTSVTSDDLPRAFPVLLLGVVAIIGWASPSSAAPLVLPASCGVLLVALTAIGSALDRSPADVALPPPSVLALAATLFLGHALAALRVTMPRGSSVDVQVIIRWARRTAEALVPGLALGWLALQAPAGPDSADLRWLAGAAALVVLVGMPVVVLRIRPWRRTGEPAPR